MSKKKQARRQFTAEYNAAVLRRHLADKVPVSDICDSYTPLVHLATERLTPDT